MNVGREFLVVILFFALATTASACPFCSALPHTLSDDLEESSVAVVVHCRGASAGVDGIYTCKMQITDVIKGDSVLKNSVVEVESSTQLSTNSVYWLVSFGDEELNWAPPELISTDAIGYLRGLSRLPENGVTRLSYFLNFLPHQDDFIAADAYNEFAEASLDEIHGLRERLDRRWVIAQLQNGSTPVHRRRLCWTFLSQCGTAADIGLFDDAMRKREIDHDYDPGMDAAIACLITLGGESSLARIEREFVSNPATTYADRIAAINAIRVHGTEYGVISRSRLAATLRRLLDRPELADLVIPDLARWQDWSAVDRMVELFSESTEETSLLKPAIVRYLKACELPEAAEALGKLRSIDKQAVERAESSMLLYSGVASVPVPMSMSDIGPPKTASGEPSWQSENDTKNQPRQGEPRRR